MTNSFYVPSGNPRAICLGCPGRMMGDCATCENARRIAEWEDREEAKE